MIRVGIFGAGGKMGRVLCGAVADDPELELVAAIDPSRAGTALGQLVARPDLDLTVAPDAGALTDAGAHVAVDFTRPDAVLDNVKAAVEAGVHVVVGTTGIDGQGLRDIEAWLSKAEGVQGYDWLTEELYGKEGLRDRYYGPPASTAAQITNPTGVTRTDRRHVLVINYSYEIPNPTPDHAFLKHVLGGWEAAGVTQFMSGNPLDPICSTNLTGIANVDPSLSGIFRSGTPTDRNATDSRCELTGEPIYSGFTVDNSLPEEDQMHFNVNAFRRPRPNGNG